MTNANLYETVPQDPFSIRIIHYEHSRYSFSAHWHEHTEIHLILDGTCTLLCNGEKIRLCAGDCAIINGNELHQGGGGSCHFLCLLLSPAFFGNQYIILERLIKDEQINRLADEIAKDAEASALENSLACKGYVYLLLSHLVRHHTARAMNGSVHSKHFTKLEKLNRAITFLNQNYTKPITTSELAEMVYLSEGYFCQLFKEVTGKSAMEYLNALRVEKAEHLLKTSSMSVSEISFCCGFGDANYFSRMYKKIKGETPKETRAFVPM